MNQFYRALHMPPKRLLRKVMGEKEVYTIAVRPRPTAEGTEPLPALDGGRVFLLLVNTVFTAITKKKIPAKYEGYVHAAGMVLLLALMAFVMFNDIWRLFQ